MQRAHVAFSHQDYRALEAMRIGSNKNVREHATGVVFYIYQSVKRNGNKVEK